MGRRVALTELISDPGVEAAAEIVVSAPNPAGTPGAAAVPAATGPSEAPPPPEAVPVPAPGPAATTAPEPSPGPPADPDPDVPAHDAVAEPVILAGRPSSARATAEGAPRARVVRSPSRPAAAAPTRSPARATPRARPVAAARTVDVPADPAAEDDDELLFSDLERKEARLRLDQVEDLSRLAKRLNRARRGQPGRRITENTLIRVALDYLLEHQGQLAGRSESELLDDLRAAR